MSEQIEMLQQRLLDHVDECEKRFNQGSGQMDSILECTTKNSESIKTLASNVAELTNNVGELTDNTKGLVQIYQDVQGAARMGMFVKRVFTWLIGLPIVGAGFFTVYHWVLEFIRPGEGIP